MCRSMLLSRRKMARDERESEDRRIGISLERVVEPVWVWGVPFAPFSMAEAVSSDREANRCGPAQLFHHGQCSLRDAD